jgi:hypothetical protein
MIVLIIGPREPLAPDQELYTPRDQALPGVIGRAALFALRRALAG